MPAAEPLLRLRPLVLGDEHDAVGVTEQTPQLAPAVAAREPVVHVEADSRTLTPQSFPLRKAGGGVVALVEEDEVRVLAADHLDRGVVDVPEVRAQPSEPTPRDVPSEVGHREPDGAVRHGQRSRVLGSEPRREGDGCRSAGPFVRLAEALGHPEQGAPLGSLRHRHVHDAGRRGDAHGPSSTMSSRWMTSRSYCGPSSRARSWVERPSMPGSSSDE